MFSLFPVAIGIVAAVGALIYGSYKVTAIAENYCTSIPYVPGTSEGTANMTNLNQFRISGANMTCTKGESSTFALALQGGRRCVQYLNPDLIDGNSWEAGMMECNNRGGHLPHFYNSVDVEKMSKWLPRLRKVFPYIQAPYGWSGHKATSEEAYKSRNTSEVAWYVNPTTTIGINLDLMEQDQIIWQSINGVVLNIQLYVGQFYVSVESQRGQPFFSYNGYKQLVYCEYESPEYVAEFIKYASKRSPAPIFNSQETSSGLSCAEMCAKYKHCMGFNEIFIAQDKKKCDLVAFIMIDLVNSTLIDDFNSTYYDLVVD